ncbi:c-type cytochrome [Bacteroidota bacterium]
MKLFVKILLGILILLVLGVAGMLSYVKFALPKVSDAPDIKVEITTERLERGDYLSNYVSGCIECHSQRDWHTFSGPVVPGTEGGGGMAYTHEMGTPGTLYPPNITAVGLGEWTDGEIFHAITAGIGRNGEALYPLMPYHDYGKMDREDIYSIIAYLRSLEPVGTVTPERELDFPLGLIVNLMPVEPGFSEFPDTTDWVAYGKYLSTAGGCISCHSLQDDKGMKVPGMLMAGGNEYPMPGFGIVRSSNLTPDVETGIGRWTENAWVARIAVYSDSSVVMPAVNPREFNSVMGWSTHSHMTEKDLRAIYRYIQTVEPVSNKVERFTSER